MTRKPFLSLAALVLSAAANADEPDFSHNHCRADDPAPCILGIPVGLAEACVRASHANFWPFLRVDTVIGRHVNDYYFAESVQWWMIYGLRDMLARLGRPELEGAVTATGLGSMEGWSPSRLAERGWRQGDPITLLVPLAERDTSLPSALPTAELPVFCGAWAREIGVGPEAAPTAGVWLAHPSGCASPAR